MKYLIMQAKITPEFFLTFSQMTDEFKIDRGGKSDVVTELGHEIE